MKTKDLHAEIIEVHELADQYSGLLNVEQLTFIRNGSDRDIVYGMNLGINR